MDALLTVEDVAGLFKVVPKTVNAWVRKGLLVATEIGGVRRFAQADVEAAQRAARHRHVDPDGAGTDQERPTAIGQAGHGWNESACRPYGMTMAAWMALGLTKDEWVARERGETVASPRRRTRRRAS
jgi:excisionase family DNA binding protein